MLSLDISRSLGRHGGCSVRAFEAFKCQSRLLTNCPVE